MIKKELEEKALEIYKPEEYQIIKSKMEENHYTIDMKEKYLQYIKEILKGINSNTSVYGRVKKYIQCLQQTEKTAKRNR